MKVIFKIPAYLTLLFFFNQCAKPAKELQRIELHDNWQFVENGYDDWKLATVPGVIHTDLLAHQLIPDPWTGTHEKDVQWVETKSWQYKTQYKLTSNELSYDQINLVFEGLDTYAEVKINGQKALNSDNMFRTWTVNAKNLLKSGNNEIVVTFHSPQTINKSKIQQLGYALPGGGETVDLMVSPFTRKAPYQFGWDWGPRLVTAGIWRPVYLELWNKASIENVQIKQNQLTDRLATLTAIVTLHSTGNKKVELNVMDQSKSVTLEEGVNQISIDFEIKDPKRWWPNGWGEANQYDVPITLAIDGNVIDSKNQKIGLRTVELIQEDDDTGRSFYFKINGEPIFVKGANYIPQSHFLPSVKPEDYEKLILEAKNANMNMLRVWGGGIYENDEFYALCDANGIMIWQDFMFACSMYPGDSAFVENVRLEVQDNIKRLRNHASIVHWNGNNEMEVAWKNWGWQNKFGYSREDSTQIWQDYLKMFNEVIPKELDQLDGSRPYTTTSPLSNWGKPAFFNSGSMHYWGVWHGPDDFSGYQKNVPRFMSEFGFQSFPNIETVAYFADSADWDLDSEVMKHHQKSYIGNGLIDQFATQYYKKPDSFEEFVMLSQKTQALGMQMAIDAQRLKKGHCWGTLYWQLNDCWPGPSWSSIDVFGRKKEFHKQLPTLFAPVALIPKFEDKTLEITLVNDQLENFSGTMTLLLKKGQKTIWENEKQVSVEPNDLKQVYRMHEDKILDGMNPEDVEIEFSLSKDGTVLFSRTYSF